MYKSIPTAVRTCWGVLFAGAVLLAFTGPAAFAQQIGVAKWVSQGPTGPAGDGSYALQFTILVKNTGTEPLKEVQVTDDLAFWFSDAHAWQVTVPPTVTGSPATFVANSLFDGTLDKNLLTDVVAPGHTLAVSEERIIKFSVKIVPRHQDNPSCFGTCVEDQYEFFNTAVATAKSAVDDWPVTDDSQSGINPDPNNNGRTDDNDEPTPIVIKAEKTTIGNQVFYDTNQNGIWDSGAGEPVISGTLYPGVIISLYYWDPIDGCDTVSGALDTTAPNASGEYSFQVLVGQSYCVGLEDTATGSDLLISPRPVPTPLTADNDNDLTGAKVTGEIVPKTDLSAENNWVDLGVYVSGKISGTVWCEGSIHAGTIPNTTYENPPDYLQNDVTVRLYYDADCDNAADPTQPAGWPVVTATAGGVPNYTFSGLFVGPPPQCYVVEVDETDEQLVCKDLLTTNPTPVTLTYNPANGGSGQDATVDVGYIDALPQIGVAKAVSAGPTKLVAPGIPANTYEVEITITVENLGNVPLSGVQVTDDLESVFVPGTGCWYVTGISSSTLTVNPGFNGGDLLACAGEPTLGSSDVNLLSSTLPNNNTLAIGQVKTVKFTVRFQPIDQGAIFYNTAVASAVDPYTNPTTDTSDNGTDPDPNGNYNPGDPGESDPTPIFTDDPALSVEVTSFTAEQLGQDIVLNWVTASEGKTTAFEIEQRFEDGEFESVTFVNRQGSTEAGAAYAYTVARVPYGRHTFRLKSVDVDGAAKVSSEVEVQAVLPRDFVLEQAYPNPFNPSTNFRFAIRESQQVTIDLYTALGQKVKSLYQGTPAAGQSHSVRIDAADLTSGMYIIRMTGENLSASQSVVLLK